MGWRRQNHQEVDKYFGLLQKKPKVIVLFHKRYVILRPDIPQDRSCFLGGEFAILMPSLFEILFANMTSLSRRNICHCDSTLVFSPLCRFAIVTHQEIRQCECDPSPELHY